MYLLGCLALGFGAVFGVILLAIGQVLIDDLRNDIKEENPKSMDFSSIKAENKSHHKGASK